MKKIKILTIIIFIMTPLINCFGQTNQQTPFDWEKRYNEIIAEYDQKIVSSPNNPNYYYTRGDTKLKIKDFTGAISDFNKTILISPNYAIAYSNRGYSKFILEDYRGAIEDFTKAIDNEIYDGKDTYFYRGIAKLKLKQKDSGCLDLSKAGELGNSDAYELIKKYCN
jgi:tetratricopeptide (TPR) repeat protein